MAHLMSSRPEHLRLLVGNPNYSTWSLRPWLLLTWHKVPFELQQVSLKNPGLYERLHAFSPSARVPVLFDAGECIWDSLAICEAVSERYLQGKGWPEDPQQRAHARCVAAEMHAGFSALRSEAPMNLRARRRIVLSAEAKRDLQRVQELWADCRARYAAQGDWLFGSFSIADCMFAPLALRLPTYGLRLEGRAGAYAERLQNAAVMQAWYALAQADLEVIAEDEVGEDV